MKERCAGCRHWIIGTKIVYEDGSEIVDQPHGDGTCTIIQARTPADFGCFQFAQQLDADDHYEIVWKQGAPWQNWLMIPCPDCQGFGSKNNTACHRCAGTSKVRRYDDGYIGEERTRRHPKEGSDHPTALSGITLQPLPKKDDVI